MAHTWSSGCEHTRPSKTLHLFECATGLNYARAIHYVVSHSVIRNSALTSFLLSVLAQKHCPAILHRTRAPPDIPEKYEADFGIIGRLLCTRVSQMRQSSKPKTLTLTPLAMKPVPSLKPAGSTPTTPTTPMAFKPGTPGLTSPFLVTHTKPSTPTSPVVVASGPMATSSTVHSMNSPTIPRPKDGSITWAFIQVTFLC